jgi:secreted trypsin-like serine protease
MTAKRWRRVLIGALATVLAMAVAVPMASAREQRPPTPDAFQGEPATQPYPFMASLILHGKPHCGGTLIAPTWVVTTAHCHAWAPDTKPDKVRIGSLTWQSGGELIDVAEWIDHPAVDDGRDTWRGNDISLVRLATPSTLAPVTLASHAGTGDAVRVMGWGADCSEATRECADHRSDTLKQLDVGLIDAELCGPPWINVERDWCVRGDIDRNHRKHVCDGDYGGPVLMLADGAWRLAGVLSRPVRTNQCGQISAVIATNALYHREWITSVISG